MTTFTGYITTDEFREFIGSGTSDKETSIQAAITAASFEVSAFCGRKFYQTTDFQTFSPEPNNLYILSLGDMDLAAEPTTVTVDFAGAGLWPETRTFGTDFICEPRNQSVNGIEGWPFTYLRSINGKIWPQRYQEYYQDTVKITGTFGWPAIPEPVKTATKILTNQFYKISEAPMGVAGVNGWGDVRVKDIPVVTSILQPYRKQSTKFLVA